jgi:hypothetical protein
MRRLKRPDIEFHWSATKQYTLILLYVVAWAIYGGALYLLLEALDVNAAATGPETLSRVLFVIGANALAWTIGFLAFFAPNGLGVREASLAFFLKQILPASVATLASLLARVWVTLAEVVIVSAGWWIARGAACGPAPGRARDGAVTAP